MSYDGINLSSHGIPRGEFAHPGFTIRRCSFIQWWDVTDAQSPWKLIKVPDVMAIDNVIITPGPNRITRLLHDDIANKMYKDASNGYIDVYNNYTELQVRLMPDKPYRMGDYSDSIDYDGDTSLSGYNQKHFWLKPQKVYSADLIHAKHRKGETRIIGYRH